MKNPKLPSSDPSFHPQKKYTVLSVKVTADKHAVDVNRLTGSNQKSLLHAD